MKRFLSITLCTCIMASLAGCSRQTADTYTPVSGLDTTQSVTIKIAIPYETNKALNTVSNAFMTKYPNVNIQLQYIEDYDKNALQLFKENALDIILQKDVSYTEYTIKNEATGEKIAVGDTTEDYFYNFATETEIDFSDTTPDITNNYRHTRTDNSGNVFTYQYCYPLGGETRGVFVNKTLLDSYGLAVPTNYNEFLACCETLKQNGLIPIQGGGDTAAYGLGLAPAANAVTHDEAALNAMRNAESGISHQFSDTMRKLYTIATNRYFDYKVVEQLGYYTSTDELGQSESFLGLQTDKTTFEVTKPENNYGYAAFMPYLSSTAAVIQSLIDEYELDTEVVFICSPLNDEGENSPVYITPFFGICLNKNSTNLIWLREFANFLFDEKNNRLYAEDASIIPNITDALSYVADKYDVDVHTDVTLCGQIRFSDSYNGYTPLANSFKTVMKGNAQKYMINLNKNASGNIQYETDAAGNEFLYLGNGETVIFKEYIGEEDSAMPGYAFCTFEYYMDYLENEFAAFRKDAEK